MDLFAHAPMLKSSPDGFDRLLASGCRMAVWLLGPHMTMTELRETVDRLSESEHQLRLVTDNAPVGIAHFDTELRYKFLNLYHAERLKARLGLTPEQVIGKPIPEVLGDKLFAIFEPHIRECLSGKAVEFELELPYQVGEPQFVQYRLEPEWSGGPFVGLVAAGTDITRLKRAEASLRDSKDRLQFALDAAELGWWHYDPLRRVISGDTRAKDLFDVARDDIPIEDIVMKRLHSHDAQRVWAAFQAALDPADPKPYATQYRVKRTDGTVRWVEAHGLAHFEGTGPERSAVSIVGTVQDITERKEREEKEHLLMQEINHRTKNMLGVVHSIAKQTATQTPEDFIERFSGRIHALSATQDLLVRNYGMASRSRT
jgi:PAS domain S-box-containing protein